MNSLIPLGKGLPNSKPKLGWFMEVYGIFLSLKAQTFAHGLYQRKFFQEETLQAELKELEQRIGFAPIGITESLGRLVVHPNEWAN